MSAAGESVPPDHGKATSNPAHLDQPRTKSRWKAGLALLLQMLLGAAFGAGSMVLLLRSGIRVAPPGTAKPLVLAVVAFSIPVAMLLTVVLHELGHAVLGRATGGVLLRFVVGPWRCSRHRHGFRWVRARSLRGIGGFVQTLLPADGRFRQSMSLMLIGGPLANLLTAAVCAVPLAFDVVWPVRVFALVLMVLSLLIGGVNLVPLRAGGFMTDGLQLQQLWTRPGALVHSQRLARLARASVDGIRPRELDPDDLAAFDPDTTTGYERFVALLLHSMALYDRGEHAAAREMLDRALKDWDHWPDGFRQLLALAAASLSAEVDADVAAAKAWLAKVAGGLVEDYHVAWVEALIAGLEGREDDRANALERVRSGLDDTIYRGDERVYREKLAALAQERAGQVATGEVVGQTVAT